MTKQTRKKELRKIPFVILPLIRENCCAKKKIRKKVKKKNRQQTKETQKVKRKNKRELSTNHRHSFGRTVKRIISELKSNNIQRCRAPQQRESTNTPLGSIYRIVLKEKPS